MTATQNGSCESGLTPSENTRLAGIEQLVGEGKFYAALAQLDALGAATSPQVRLVRADALRRVDHAAEAQAIYQDLLNTCLAGRAHHGLGLIAARAGQKAESIEHLRQAREALPTDPRVRNDYGYALLLDNQLSAAQFEFLTVLELNPQDPRAGRNLVLLTFKRGEPDKAKALASKLGLDAETTDQLRQDALANNPPLPPASDPAPSSATPSQPAASAPATSTQQGTP